MVSILFLFLMDQKYGGLFQRPLTFIKKSNLRPDAAQCFLRDAQVGGDHA